MGRANQPLSVWHMGSGHRLSAFAGTPCRGRTRTKITGRSIVKIRLPVYLLVAAAALCSLPRLAAAATPPAWKENGYGYNTVADTPLRKVLADFARNFGVELKISGDFPEPVNGRLQGASAIEFLDRLGTLHRYQWFVYNNVLYISPISDAVVERIEVDPDAVDQIKPALMGLGLYDPKFGWGELGEAGSVSVSGPSEYVRLVRQLIQRQELRRDDYEAMVFKLKYASVDDRRIMVRDQAVVTQGIASMLRSLISSHPRGNRRFKLARGTDPAWVESLHPGRAPAPPLLGAALPMPFGAGPQTQAAGQLPALQQNAAQQGAQAPQAEAAEPAGAGGGTSVIGDVRTNSIIIFDSPRKRDYYQKLINSLDVPQKLVEIEAYIVDVNRERLSEFSADFSLGGAKWNVGLGTAVSTLAAGALPTTTLMVQSLGKFFARLQMLETKGDARTLAKPNVLTLENLTAVLDMSQTVYLRATGERVAQISPVTAGTLLRVTPRTIEENGTTRVSLMVDIEDGAINAIPNTDMPEVQKSTISTQAILDNQESLVIGGYDVDSSGNRISAVPGISKVPLVGGLFSSRDATSQSRQRLFIITPRVVRTGAERDRAEASLATEQVVTLAPSAPAVAAGRLRLSNQIGSSLPRELRVPPPVVPSAQAVAEELPQAVEAPAEPPQETPAATQQAESVPGAANPEPAPPLPPPPGQRPDRIGPVLQLEPPGR